MRRAVLIAVPLAALLVGVGVADAVSVTGVVTVGGQPASGTIVYLEGQIEPDPAPTPAHVVMDQKDLAFVPGTLPVARGTVVEFRNSDDVEHNVFSPTETVKQFDLGSYRRGESRSVVFDRVGEVLVLCNIHMEMAARILVLRDPYFARLGPDGGYRLDVPPGVYTLRLYRDGWLAHTQSVEVTEGPSATIDATVP